MIPQLILKRSTKSLVKTLLTLLDQVFFWGYTGLIDNIIEFD